MHVDVIGINKDNGELNNVLNIIYARSFKKCDKIKWGKSAVISAVISKTEFALLSPSLFEKNISSSSYQLSAIIFQNYSK